MDGRALIYIVFGIIYLIVQYNRAQKKRQQQSQGKGGADKPIQPPSPQKDRDTFKDIFESAQQKFEDRRKPKQQKPPQPPQQFNPPPRREYQSVKPVKEELDENYSDSSMKDMIAYEQPRDLQTTVAPASVNYDGDMVNPILNNFDLRNAVIAQIILERPEF